MMRQTNVVIVNQLMIAEKNNVGVIEKFIEINLNILYVVWCIDLL